MLEQIQKQYVINSLNFSFPSKKKKMLDLLFAQWICTFLIALTSDLLVSKGQQQISGLSGELIRSHMLPLFISEGFKRPALFVQTQTCFTEI